MHLKGYRQLLATYLAPQWRLVIILAILLCGDIALQIVNPQLLRIFIDTITSTGVQNGILGVALLFIGVALVQQIVKIFATYFSERVGWSATNALRLDLTEHLVTLDMGFHKRHTPGELIERVDGDVTALANFFSQFIIKIVGNLLLLLGVLIVLAFQDWQASIALILFTIIALLLIASARNIAVKYWKAFRQSTAELFGFLEERLHGTEDIRSSGAQEYVMLRLYRHTRQRFRTGRTARVMSVAVWTMPIITSLMGTMVAFLVIAWFYSRNEMSLGMAFLIYFYTQLIFQPIQAITDQLDDFQKASAGFIRIREMLEVQSELEDGPGATFPEGALDVEFEDVSFGYGEEDLTVRNLAFRVEAGKVLGLLGRTGSGKTTITRLLFRLYDPASGVIRLGGQDIRAAKRADLRNLVGMVTQDVQLFHASVRDNLTFFDKSIDDTRIIQAIETLGMGQWYKELPEGLDTMLASNGGGLSAGEAQLLAFARVFLRNPSVVILDEASSRLDPATERLLEQAIDKLLKGRTAIIIAHRLSTVQRADSIMVLDKGSISELGARTELANDYDSYFSHLLRAAHEEVLQ
ncbi:ABC transporter ATP-binding protein [Ktedonospora formicarum]|uniref:Helicase n=1 Tax=Ktedonospora formicarum TaxID=2778364 RepID=A0A8J3I685_9CHLR|nr:ABC transporter ATP-binding protein [Ktedonospora formicarum]GHO46638.1 helicase [Ktedonospora formicarum]